LNLSISAAISSSVSPSAVITIPAKGPGGNHALRFPSAQPPNLLALG
jgi:hypothetical protein